MVEPKYLNVYEIISRIRNLGMVGGFLTNFERGVEQVSFYVNFKLTLQQPRKYNFDDWGERGDCADFYKVKS